MHIPYEKGLSPNSEIYIMTPSNLALRMLYHIDRAGHYIADSHYCVNRDSYPGYFLMYVKSGELSVTYRGNEYQAKQGDFCFIDCQEPHIYRSVSNSEFIWLHFGGSNTADFFEEIMRSFGAVFTPANADRIYMQLSKLIDLFRENDSIEENAATTRIYSILCSLLYSSSIDETISPMISSAQKYLREHLAYSTSVPELAAHCHLSPSQFTRLFKTYTGQSPHEYTINLRINQAKILLLETELSITEIASRVGYDYSTSFEAIFKRKVGISPRRFRQMSI